MENIEQILLRIYIIIVMLELLERVLNSTVCFSIEIYGNFAKGIFFFQDYFEEKIEFCRATEKQTSSHLSPKKYTCFYIV